MEGRVGKGGKRRQGIVGRGKVWETDCRFVLGLSSVAVAGATSSFLGSERFGGKQNTGKVYLGIIISV